MLRFRDLVDLVALARGASVEPQQAVAAVRAEAERRNVALPRSFDVPSRKQWERGYAKEAAESLLTDASTLDEALAIVRPFVNPLLQGTADGRWDHERRDWTESKQRAD
jgi:hypothetical protein